MTRPVAVAMLRSAALAIAILPGVASAQASPAPTMSASPVPSPAPTSSDAASDPCATTLALVSRPSVTTSACAVKAHHAMLETGYQNTVPDAGAPVAQYPQALIRVGTSIPGLEVSVAPPSENRSAQISGASDTSFGLKYEIGYSNRWVTGVNGFVTVPTGSNGYSAGGTGYTLNANASYTVTPGLSSAATLGFNSLSDSSQRYMSIIPSLVLSGSLTSTTAAFGELATFSNATGPGSSSRLQLLGGFQQAIANRIQFDVEAGRSPTQSTGKYRYVGIGLSVYQ